jgi:GT2 family glycosyltransferase/glycosyltransferase involved in cell wall biosynthesis
LEGFVDQANPQVISGWVWDPHRPDHRVTLELMDGNVRLASTVANLYRADLEPAGIGDGRHAFTIPVRQDLLAAERNTLHLRCVETRREVPGSPIIIDRVLPVAAQRQAPYEPAEPDIPANGADAPKPKSDGVDEPVAVAAEPADTPPEQPETATAAIPAAKAEIQAKKGLESGLQSHIDSADWAGIRGWVCDPLEPQKRIVLELLDGDTPLATVLAHQYRSDLAQAGIGDGRYGFSVSFTETLLPNAMHLLHLRPVGSEVDLPLFPLVLTRDHAGLDPSVRFVLGNLVAEAENAQSTEQVAPIVSALVGFLDSVASRYFDLVDETEASAADLLKPTELGPQFRTLVDSLQRNYPPLRLDAARPPVVSVIIPVFNKFELTYNCIRSIIDQGAQMPFEIIVVDDCSRDETMLAGLVLGPGIRLVRNEANAGFIRSCNRGFDAARGGYIVFLNNDTEVKARWLDELYETMQRDPQIGIAGSKLLYPDGTLQECGGIVWRLGDGWNWGRGEAADDPRYCYMRDADYVSGAALMVRKSLFAGVGKFDEHYLPAYYEDTELCFRARQAGYRVVVQPASEVVHFEGASAGTDTAGSGMKRFQKINHRKFFERWKDALATHRFNGELSDLEVERTIRQRALFIDDSVPEPDKDAGSNAALQHMLSLQRLGYKVTFIPGDNMAKIDPYTTDLQRRGIECLYHPYYFSVEDVFRKRRLPVDLVYLHRYSNASKYAGMVRQHFPKARILYSVADLHFLRVERQAEVQGDPGLRDKAEQLRRLELGAMSFVDTVIVHSAAEAELLGKLVPGIDVRVIPWTIPLRENSNGLAGNPTIALIGGYGHPPNVDAAQWAASSIMPLLRKRVPGIELLLVGSKMPVEVSALAAKDVVPLGHVPSLDSVFERVRLTIAPLRYGAGLKGKVLESFAAGVPCVMTGISAEGLELPADLEWLVADKPEVLADRIAALCRDDDRHRRIAKACRAHVAANYGPERIDTLIREACGVE